MRPCGHAPNYTKRNKKELEILSWVKNHFVAHIQFRGSKSQHEFRNTRHAHHIQLIKLTPKSFRKVSRLRELSIPDADLRDQSSCNERAVEFNMHTLRMHCLITRRDLTRTLQYKEIIMAPLSNSEKNHQN